MRVRGLKPVLLTTEPLRGVAPYAGAWIETRFYKAMRFQQ